MTLESYDTRLITTYNQIKAAVTLITQALIADPSTTSQQHRNQSRRADLDIG